MLCENCDSGFLKVRVVCAYDIRRGPKRLRSAQGCCGKPEANFRNWKDESNWLTMALAEKKEEERKMKKDHG